MKLCKKCNIEKPIDDFYKRSDGYYRRECKECVVERSINYASNNKTVRKSIMRKYYVNNIDSIKLKSSNYNFLKKDDLKKVRYNNRHKRRENHINRMNTDDIYKLSESIRCSIKSAIFKSGYSKNTRTYKILGCSFEEFKIYIESKFESWMTWNNYGKYNGELNYGWDFDHIIPISSAVTEDDVIKLNNFSNFQPLCSYINRNIKRDNY